jgi:Holliday junction resolvase RusA-like endonuclease
MPTWTSHDLRAFQDRVARLRAPQPERPARETLVSPVPGEAAGRASSQGRFSVTFKIFSCRPLDFDNAFTKPLQDALVEAGLLPGDDWRTLEGRVASHKARSKAEERTEVTIERLE